MNTKQILLFCAATLSATTAVVTVLFQTAALSPQALARARTPQPMESFQPLDLGFPYGSVSMTDLVGHYLEHPPQPAASGGGASAQPPQIGGC